MITKIFQLLIFCTVACQCNAQIFTGNGGGRSAGLGNASSNLNDGYALYNNQAGIAYVNQVTAWIFSERKFFETNLSLHGAGMLIPTNSGTFGFQVNYFGYELFNQKKIGLAYGRKFSNAVSGGLQIEYLGTSIFETGNANSITFEAGVQVKVLSQLNFAAHVFNPMRLKTGFDLNETIPTVFTAGFKYQPSNKLLLVADVEKDIDYKPCLKTGIEYCPVNKLILRAGIHSQPFQSCFGLGLNLDDLKIDLAASYHATLGYTPTLSVCYSFGKKKSD